LSLVSKFSIPNEKNKIYWTFLISLHHTFFQDNSGSLSVEEFMTLPELQQNPLVQRVIDIFDEDGNGEVDFKEFIQGVSQFSVKGDKTSKLRFAFRIYDIDNDGYISNGELFQVDNFFIKRWLGGFSVIFSALVCL